MKKIFKTLTVILSQTIRTLTIIVLALIGILLFVQVLEDGIRRHERNECVKWEQDSREYPIWYSTDWQKAQCKQFGIEL